MHLSRSSSRMLIVTLAIWGIGDPRNPKRPRQTAGETTQGGHLNLAQSGHLNFAAIFLVRIMYVMLNYTIGARWKHPLLEFLGAKLCTELP
jgi:hypothetical protein